MCAHHQRLGPRPGLSITRWMRWRWCETCLGRACKLRFAAAGQTNRLQGPVGLQSCWPAREELNSPRWSGSSAASAASTLPGFFPRWQMRTDTLEHLSGDTHAAERYSCTPISSPSSHTGVLYIYDVERGLVRAKASLRCHLTCRRKCFSHNWKTARLQQHPAGDV